MLKKLELDVLNADLGTVQSLLDSRTKEDDPIGYFQFSSRLKNIQEKISQVVNRQIKHAELGVFFGGGPVQGSRGINADFAGKTLDDFQALISKRFSERENGALKQRGRLPLADHSQMIVTDVMRGSFGFILEESGDTEEIIDTPLKEIVDEVSDILLRAGAIEEAVFEEAASELDSRMLVTLKQLFLRLDDEQATLRIVSGDRDFLLDRNAISLARTRIQELEIDEHGDEFVGTLFLLPQSRRFDFFTQINGEKTVLKGSVGPEVLKQLSGEQDFSEPAVDVRTITTHTWRVEIKTREIRERNRVPRKVYTLSRLKTPEDVKIEQS
ncbi:hypothetical protein ACO0K0_03840 [Undibacterium sp. SXout11W]|uniref:hypothetical protein n=1 Tax=Undibacterium sp. SXout11W TaxID=3413050 RepID=UPI003BF42F57